MDIEATIIIKQMEEHTFRKLLVWQKSMQLVTNVYKTAQLLPKEEMYALTSQIKKCAVSIPSNIAEGYGRETNKEYLRFLNIALSSLFELQTQLEIAYNLNYFNQDDFNLLYEQTREIERMLTSFIKKIKP